MHAVNFLQDLAVVMLVAGLVTIIFHRFNQPVVLGYIIAGVIIGPHTPPYALIHDEAISELELRTRTGASIVGIERSGGNIINPSADEELQSGDQVLLVGTRDQLDSAKAVFSKHA